MTALPLFGVAAALVAEVPSTPPAAAGVLVGTLVGVGMGLEVATGMGVLVPVAVEVVLVCVDLVVVWLDVTACVVCVEVADFVVVEVGVAVGVAADTTCTDVDPESSVPAGP
jgi:hypothetical protein